MAKHLIVVSFQEENWGDDGGEHDPVLLEVDDATLAWLAKYDGEVVSKQRLEELREMEVLQTLPAMIAWVGTIWYRYGR